MTDPVFVSDAQTEQLPLATVGMRIWSVILEAILVVVTLGIGWLIWYFVVVGRGLTPARAILKLKVIDFITRTEVSPGKAFFRGFVVYYLIFGVLASAIGGALFAGPYILTLIAGAFIFRESRQTLWDQVTNTVIGQGR